jgi:Mrp family chromosome partitioning ATPase
MSLMLNALKRIEAKHPPSPAKKPAEGAEKTELTPIATVEPVAPPPLVDSTEPIELPPAPTSDDLPSPDSDDFALREPVSLDAAMDQLQAFVAEAGLLYDSEVEITLADFHVADESEEVQPTESSTTGQATLRAEESPKSTIAPMPRIEIHEPGIELTKHANSPASEPPAVAPLVTDPYAMAAQNILRQLPGDRAQVLLFTSPADGQGKTMTLARLAPWLAQGIVGNVLVVDANFRNPDMARWLAVAPARRLTDVLAGSAGWAAAVQTTALDRVSLLPGGADIVGSVTGQSHQGMSHLLRDLARHYELVVVDAPSLAHRGAVQLAAACDAIYLIVRLGDACPRMLREAADIVEHNGGRLLGCIAIDVGV